MRNYKVVIEFIYTKGIFSRILINRKNILLVNTLVIEHYDEFVRKNKVKNINISVKITGGGSKHEVTVFHIMSDKIINNIYINLN